jgi:hypothetical protein
MRAGSLRVGGQGLRTTYDDHVIIIGDAAGFIDPLTGECGARLPDLALCPAMQGRRWVMAGVQIVGADCDCVHERRHVCLVCLAAPSSVSCSLSGCFTSTVAGEGIHTAMMAGKVAAETLLACREAGNYSSKNTRLYERAWMDSFGHDFKLVSSALSLPFASYSLYTWQHFWHSRERRRGCRRPSQPHGMHRTSQSSA